MSRHPPVQQKQSSVPALLLLSGLLCDEEMWADVVPKLEPVCTPIPLCFPDFSSIEAMAEHVLATAPDSFAIAGHSMGGRVALEVYRRAPSRVLGVALLNTGVHVTRAQESSRRGRLVDIARHEGLTALANEWLPPMLFDAKSPDDPLLIRLNRMVERNSAESFAAQIHALLNRPEAESVVSNLQVPTLLLSATGDRWSPPAQHAAMRDLCPRATLVIVAAAGHMSPAERPDIVAAALNDWINRVIEASAGVRPASLEQLLIREACTQQIYKYARLNDLAAWTSLSKLFTESGVLYRPSDPAVPISGRTEILKAFQSRPARLTRHVVSNVEVFVESASRAYAVSSILLHVATDPVSAPTIGSTAIGQFHDALIKHAEQWLFAERRGSIAMLSAVQTGATTR